MICKRPEECCQNEMMLNFPFLQDSKVLTFICFNSNCRNINNEERNLDEIDQREGDGSGREQALRLRSASHTFPLIYIQETTAHPIG